MSLNQVGYAAVEAEKRKVAKYKTLADQFIFYPVGIKTFGPWGKGAIKLV